MVTKTVPEVQGRVEARHIQMVRKMREGLSGSLNDLKETLEDQKGLSPEIDNKIAYVAREVDAIEKNIRGQSILANDQTQRKAHPILHEAARRTKEQSPGAAFSYFNDLTHGNKIFAFLEPDDNPEKAEQRYFAEAERLNSFGHKLSKLTTKLKLQGSKFRLLGKVGEIGYKEALDGVSAGVEELRKSENMDEMWRLTINLAVHENVAIAARKAKDMAHAGIGAGRIAEYLDGYEIDRSREGLPATSTAVNPHYATHVKTYIFGVGSWAEEWRRSRSAELQNAIENGTLNEQQAIGVSNGLLLEYIRNNPQISGLPTAERISKALTLDEAIEVNRRAWRAFALYRGTQYMASIGLSTAQQEFLAKTLTQPDEQFYYGGNNTVWGDIEAKYWDAYTKEKTMAQGEKTEEVMPPPPPVIMT